MALSGRSNFSGVSYASPQLHRAFLWEDTSQKLLEEDSSPGTTTERCSRDMGGGTGKKIPACAKWEQAGAENG